MVPKVAADLVYFYAMILPMDDLSGQLVKGYDLLDRIGAGGLGAVYRARQTTVGREVAIKIILPAYANDLDFTRLVMVGLYCMTRLSTRLIE